MQIPHEWRAALDEALEGVPRNELAQRAERKSSLYRDRTGSSIHYPGCTIHAKHGWKP